MATQLLLGTIVLLLLACIALLLVLLRRPGRADPQGIEARLARVSEGQERAERAVREEIARSREEAGSAGHLLRGEVGTSLKAIDDRVFQHLGVLSSRQQEQLAGVMDALRQMTESTHDGARALREEVGVTLKGVSDSVVLTLGEMSAAQKREIEAFSTRIGALGASSGEQLDRLRLAVEGKLDQIRDDNAAKLEQMRADRGREAPGHAGAAPRRQLPHGERAARAGAPGPGRDAEPGRRRGRPQAGPDRT